VFKAFAQGNARTALRNARAGNARSASRQEGFLFSSRVVAAFSRFGAQGTEKKGGAGKRVPTGRTNVNRCVFITTVPITKLFFLTFTYVPFSGRRPEVGHRAIFEFRENPKISFVLL
jgi:hypothetical protein